MTRRQASRAALLTALNTARPAGVPQTSQRLGPFAPGGLPAMRLVTGPRETVDGRLPNGKRGPVAIRRCNFLVECYVAGDEDDLEPLLAWVTKATVPGRLGGLVSAVVEIGTQWEADGEELDYLKATVALEVEYVTAVDDQEHGLPAAP